VGQFAAKIYYPAALSLALLGPSFQHPPLGFVNPMLCVVSAAANTLNLFANNPRLEPVALNNLIKILH
jgi:hypothetical protein